MKSWTTSLQETTIKEIISVTTSECEQKNARTITKVKFKYLADVHNVDIGVGLQSLERVAGYNWGLTTNYSSRQHLASSGQALISSHIPPPHPELTNCLLSTQPLITACTLTIHQLYYCGQNFCVHFSYITSYVIEFNSVIICASIRFA